MNQYQFEQVIRRMERRYGKIRKGGELPFQKMLEAMEHNLWLSYAENHARNGRRLMEAVPLALYRIEDRLTGRETDVSAFESPDNTPLRDALLMAFDPFSGGTAYQEMAEREHLDLSDTALLERLYRAPVMCILRIRESAEMWTKERGADGYFLFVQDFLDTSDHDFQKIIQDPDSFR